MLPFSVVVVKRLTPLCDGSNVHTAEVRVVHVSDAADSTGAEHNARVRALNKAIEDTPRPAQDLSNGVEQLGYGIDEIEQVCGSGDDGLIACTVVGPDKFSFTMAGYFSLGDD